MTSISGYTITLNCKNMGLPFEEAIRGVSSFCEEVIVYDFGSTDGTMEVLRNLELEINNVHIYEAEWDYSKPDMMGIAKTMARRKCECDWCYQFDVDEIPHEKDLEKYRVLPLAYPDYGMFTFPIISFYGGVNALNFRPSSYKWTMVKNDPRIEHGVVDFARRYDKEGKMYFDREKSDSCEYIHAENKKHISGIFAREMIMIPNALKRMREKCKAGHDTPENLQALGYMWDDVIRNEICIYHYSWVDFYRKARQHTLFWDKMLRYENGMRVPRSTSVMNSDIAKGEMTDEDIKKVAEEYQQHSFVPLNLTKEDHPAVMQRWLEKNDIPTR